MKAALGYYQKAVVITQESTRTRKEMGKGR